MAPDLNQGMVVALARCKSQFGFTKAGNENQFIQGVTLLEGVQSERAN